MKKIIICTFVAVFTLVMTSGIVRAATFIANNGDAHEATDQADVCVEGSGNSGNAVELEAGAGVLECGVKITVNLPVNAKIQCKLTNGTFGVVPALTTNGAGDLDLDGDGGANNPDVTLTSGAAGDSTLTWIVNNPLSVNDVALLDTTVDATTQGGGDGTGANTALEIEGLSDGGTLGCTWTILSDVGGTLETASGTLAKGYNCLSSSVRDDGLAAGATTDTVTVESGRVAFNDTGTDLISEANVRVTDDDDPSGNGNLVAFNPSTDYDTTITVTGDFNGVAASTVWVDIDGNDTFDDGADVELTGTGDTRSGIVDKNEQALTNGGSSDFTIKIEVDGSILSTRTFQASASVAGDGTNDTFNDSSGILSLQDFIIWISDGYQGRIPFLDTRSTVPTFCIVSNTTMGEADVFLDVLANDAGTPVSGLQNLSLGTLAAETTALLSLIGDQVTLGSNTAVTVGVGTNARYSGLLTLAINADGVLVNCFQSDAATGGKRVLPVFTGNGTTLKQ